MKNKFNFNDNFYKKPIIEKLEILIEYYTKYKVKYSKIYRNVDPVQVCKCWLKEELKLQKTK